MNDQELNEVKARFKELIERSEKRYNITPNPDLTWAQRYYNIQDKIQENINSTKAEQVGNKFNILLTLVILAPIITLIIIYRLDPGFGMKVILTGYMGFCVVLVYKFIKSRFKP